MKYLLFFCTLLLSLNVLSQNNTAKREYNEFLETRIFSSVKNSIKDDNITHIYVGYSNEKAYFIKLFTKKTTTFDRKNGDTSQSFLHKENNYYFDLNFEGDKYILNQNYPWLHLPSIEDIYPKNLPKNDEINYLSKISIYRDSTIYYFTTHKDFYGQIMPLWGFPAKYLGSIEAREQQIAKELSLNQSDAVNDSICVLEIIILKTGKVTDVKSIGGKNSELNDIAERAIFLDKNKDFGKYKPKWRAAIMYDSGRPMDTKLKMFLKLKKDGSVEISLPKTMRNYTGN
ncbi:hypothetical protein [Sphingobacterium sp. MYb388]|uniref:hypothetical protein n=1 Tax=Sphingobacterium sp. MYb388 TaxID=2745437 RepID=UPI0030B72A81